MAVQDHRQVKFHAGQVWTPDDDSTVEAVPKVGSSFTVTDANGDRYEATMVGWHCCHGMSVHDAHYEHCKTKQGVKGILSPLYRLEAI